MSNDGYVVGRAYGEMAPNQSSIYEMLLEKAKRDLEEAHKERDDWKRMYEEADWKTVEAETYKKELMETRKDRNKWGFYGEKMQQERDQWKKDSLEQARLLGKGSEREARLITERDHYKTSLESLLKSIDDWNDSMVKEPADDFIAAIAAYTTEKLEK